MKWKKNENRFERKKERKKDWKANERLLNGKGKKNESKENGRRKILDKLKVKGGENKTIDQRKKR